MYRADDDDDDDDHVGLFDGASDEFHMFKFSSERLRHNDGKPTEIWNCAKLVLSTLH